MKQLIQSSTQWDDEVRGDAPSPSSTQTLLQHLLNLLLVVTEDWDALAPAARQELLHCTAKDQLLAGLVKERLLTEYQAARIEAGKIFGLLLGNYRVLDRIGAGAMGVVFKAEHLDMRRQVAIKVLSISFDQDPRVEQRFLAEARAVARLQHPNIVGAFDAGKIVAPDSDMPVLRYFVMEYVAGEDLEEHILNHGPLSPAQACDVTYQLASALAEAHKHHLVHRDIKPSNVRLTPEGQAKLLDFGLTRDYDHRLTEPGILLGTPDYMAPEQARDAGSVDIRADIYGLGGTLFWCLTGKCPFPAAQSLVQQMHSRLTKPPPSPRALRSEIPAELDALVTRMMAVHPVDRYSTPTALMQALLPLLRPELRDHMNVSANPQLAKATANPDNGSKDGKTPQRILLVDDEASILMFSGYALRGEGFECDEAASGEAALEAVRSRCYDLVLLDMQMPAMSGPEVCRRLREAPPSPHLKIIMCSGAASGDEMARILLAGADDYLSKPFSILQLQARVKAALRLKTAQDRADLLNQHLLAANHQVEQKLNLQGNNAPIQGRDALIMALAQLVECRDSESASHLVRTQRYCRCLAEEAASLPAFANQIDANFIELLELCAPLHDIGKAGLPEHILLKPSKLTPDERLLMQAHTTIGAETLDAVARRQSCSTAFLQMARDIARHHHEHYDGQGYPDGLAGDAIPLAARLVSIGDVYDALRSRRPYKPALSHPVALRVMTDMMAGQFDPVLFDAFQCCAAKFEDIFLATGD